MGGRSQGLSPAFLRAHPDVRELIEQWPEDRVRGELDQILETWGALDLTTAIHWRWYAKLRTTAGRAVFADMMIELNPLLLARHPDQVRPILVHEAAHLVVQRLHGRQHPHGRIWKQYMRQAKESTRATHSLDVRGLRRKRKRRSGRAKLSKLMRALRRRK